MHRLYRITAGLFLIAVLVSCADLGEMPAPPRPSAERAEEQDVAQQILSGLQARSFQENTEFCGMLLRDETGQLFRTEHFQGTKDRCRVTPPLFGRVVASYHSHGGFLSGYDNEVPSVQDLEEEIDWGIDGYVSTPGGRFWRVDGRAGVVELVCGQGCLPVDVKYRDQADILGPIRSTYNLQSLTSRAQLQDTVP